MNTLSFGAPVWLWALGTLPALVLLFYVAERRGLVRLQQFASDRLLPRLVGRVDRSRRWIRYLLSLVSFAFALIALAQPRWGYTYEEVKRKGLDLIFAIDTSRSMLSNDVQPNRLERVKLAAQDLIAELRGDRVGLIAFAGRAFLQAPLTIDYDAAVDSIIDLDTNTIPEGGTNISEAISLATRTYGKSAVGNRALVIFTDGEELSGDATKTAAAAGEAGVRIFTIGVGTPEGSLIPIQGEGGGTAFVRDSKGQVVKSKLDESRLRELATSTQGFYLHLENGSRTMKTLFNDGLTKLQTGDIDDRLSRHPIERFEYPLVVAVLALITSLLISDRKRVPRVAKVRSEPVLASLAALVLLAPATSRAKSPGLALYEEEKFPEAYQHFEGTLRENPNTRQADRLHFDAGAAAYKMKNYGKALEAFSQALLSPDLQLQSKSHYNLGNTLYQRGESQKTDRDKLTDWTNALQHYEQTLKVEPQNKEANDNLEYVKRKIEDLKKKQDQPTPTPTPTPSPSPSPSKDQKKDNKKDDQKNQDQKKKDQQEKQSSQGDKKDEQQQQQSSDKNDKPEDDPEKQSGNNPDSDKEKQEQGKEGASPSPSPSPGQDQQNGGSPSPSASAADATPAGSLPQSSPSDQPGQSPSPKPDSDRQTPSPSDQGSQQSGGEEPTASPSASPPKKLTGEVKGATDEKPPDTDAEPAELEPIKEGEMNEQQARLLLQAMKDEEQKVQLDERKAARRVYNDW